MLSHHTLTYCSFAENQQNRTAILMGILLIIVGVAGFTLLKLYEKNKR